MDWVVVLLWAAPALVLFALVRILAWPVLRRIWRRWEVEQAVRQFRMQREQLEARFFDLASSQGKPRGLRWKQIDWQDWVRFARATDSGALAAFVAVNIHFEAIAGGDMEDVEAVGNIRDASAVFHYRWGRWGTGGRALFNMNPDDALKRLKGQFEPVETTEITAGT